MDKNNPNGKVKFMNISTQEQKKDKIFRIKYRVSKDNKEAVKIKLRTLP